MNTTLNLEERDRLIWSGDVDDEVALMAALPLMPGLRIIKLDQLFLLGDKFDIITQLQDLGYLVFADFKTTEIPSKLEAIAQRKILPFKPWMLNCMAGCWSSGVIEHTDRNKVDGLKRFADACHAVGTRPCAVTVLTSTEEMVVAQEYNNRTSIDQVLEYTFMLMVCGFTDIVCSPLEAAAIRANPEFDGLGLNTPGVRLADSGKGDQARVSTPDEAIRLGATRLVMGRDLTAKPENLDKILDLIRIGAAS